MNDPEIVEERSQRNWTRLIPGIVVSLAAIIILLVQIDLQTTWQAFQAIKIGPVLLAVVALVVAFITRATSWRVLLQEQVSLKSAFSAEVIGYLLNTVLPFRLGEVGRAMALGLRSPLTFWEIFPTILIERIFDLGFLAAFLFSTLPFVVGADWATTAAFVALGLVIAGFTVLFLMVRHPEWVQNIFGWITNRWPSVKEFGEDKIDQFIRGLAVLRSPARFLKVFFWLGLTWGLSVLWNTIILRTFYPNPTLLEACFIVGLAALGVAAPSTQGNLGVYEAAIVSAFIALSADPANGLAFALVTHGVYLLIIFLLGFYGLAQSGISLKEIYTLAQNRPTQQ
ncbi:MAG: lysylphosphatidylglycerol synthase transmembrane domain-containing protein [Anaerolineales bacterium]